MGLSFSEIDSVSASFLAEVKRGIKLSTSNTDHDTELTDLILAASNVLERVCKRLFKTRTVTWKLDEFPDDRCFEVPRPSLISVTSIQYFDVDNVEQTFASSKYEISTSSSPGRIELDESESWPATKDRVDAVTVTYSAGYGATEANYPAAIRQAIRLCVRHWFEELDDVGNIPAGAMKLAEGYHHGRFSQLLRA